MKIDTCTSKHLAEKVNLFWESKRSKEGWLISQVVQETGLLRPHQMPLLFEKRSGGISVLTFDTRMNFEGIRTPLLEALLPLGVPIRFYLSKQKRQHDWSTCSHISLDDLHQLDHLGTEKMFAFLESQADSVEIQKGGRWSLTVSERVPLSHMRLVQWLGDFKNYEAWALQSAVVTQDEIDVFKEKMASKNPEWRSMDPEAIDLNRRGIHRFRRNITKLVQGILNAQPPLTSCFENPSTAIILGAGISGLVSTIVLNKLGYRTILVDQGKIGANLGGGIDIQPNGTKILFSLGLEEELRRVTAFNGREITIGSDKGETLKRVPLNQYEVSPKYPLLSLFRGDLLQVLFQAARPDLLYEGLNCIKVVLGSHRISVILNDSTELSGEVLIGADGIKSIVRRTLFPDIQKQYLGHISLGGMVPRAYFVHNYVHGLNRTCVVLPCTETHCHTVMFLPKPQGWLRANTTTFEEQKALFKGWAPEVDQILDHLEEKNRFCVESHEIPPLPYLAKGRVFLVGDAAHAMSPLGALATGMALEDVRDLEYVLTTYPSLETAAEAYTALRLPRTGELREFSLLNLVSSIISHGPDDFTRRMLFLKSSTTDAVFKRQIELVQREISA